MYFPSSRQEAICSLSLSPFPLLSSVFSWYSSLLVLALVIVSCFFSIFFCSTLYSSSSSLFSYSFSLPSFLFGSYFLFLAISSFLFVLCLVPSPNPLLYVFFSTFLFLYFPFSLPFLCITITLLRFLYVHWRRKWETSRRLTVWRRVESLCFPLLPGSYLCP